MTWTDVLWLVIAVALMLTISYVSYVYIKTNSKRQLLISVWTVIIAILYFASYAMLNLVSNFNTERVMPILLFFVTLGLIKTFLKDEKDDK